MTIKNYGKFFKGKYMIVFYDKHDEHLRFMFDNISEIIKFRGQPVNDRTRQNMRKNIWNIMRSKSHQTSMLNHEILTMHIVDAPDDFVENVK